VITVSEFFFRKNFKVAAPAAVGMRESFLRDRKTGSLLIDLKQEIRKSAKFKKVFLRILYFHSSYSGIIL
jgi:hypothetical protein